MSKFITKKMIATVLAMLLVPIVAWLGTKNINLTADEQKNIIEVLMVVIGGLAATHNIAQGYADGQSGGVTSSNANPETESKPAIDVVVITTKKGK
jgi:hypothetical protein